MEILGEHIGLGESKTIQFNIAKLYTATNVEIPIIINRATKPGPTVLITAGIHGDEINGVEIVRQLIAKKINRPKKGTIICIPILNVFGFLSMSRQFPDGHDLNRVFPGTKKGSLASRVAHHFTTEILPHADYCLDFHTGGASRFNAAQIRVSPNDYVALKYAKVFNAPFVVMSKILDKSYRQTCLKMGIPSLLFEGGKSLSSDRDIIEFGVHGVLRILDHLEMLNPKFQSSKKPSDSVIIEKSTWIRAHKSGLLHTKVSINKFVEKGDILASITDPYGEMKVRVKAPNDGYIINVNESPIVHQGDAIFHISTAVS
ncbi:MAG: succinylglutamate desuccinylase/aspartoacylase family protein [Flavobacteriaceae bacterium]|nr:succinylglutamate desuccinylase/aspartoacylase family protein [Flavobacteriaceae bacterium]